MKSTKTANAVNGLMTVVALAGALGGWAILNKTEQEQALSDAEVAAQVPISSSVPSSNPAGQSGEWWQQPDSAKQIVPSNPQPVAPVPQVVQPTAVPQVVQPSAPQRQQPVTRPNRRTRTSR